MFNNKIVITGALGHIGSQLIRDIRSDIAPSLLLIDNLESQRYCSLVDLPDTHAYRFVQEDIRTGDMKKLLAGATAAIHLAAITNAEASHGREKEVEEVNFQGLQRVAEACRDSGVKLLFPSTTSVYGSQEKVVDETCVELKPQSPYAEAKLQSEQYLASQAANGLQFVICRFGTIFGPSVGMRFHTAVNKFIWQAVNGIPLTVWKTAWQQRRPYLDLRDCIRAVNFVFEKDLFDGQIYNVLTKNYTVEDIVTSIKEFVPGLVVSYVDSPIMNQLSYDVNDAKFRALGFAPDGDVRASVGATVKQFEALMK